MARARKYTPEVVAYIEEHYPTTDTNELRARLMDEFGLDVSFSSVNTYASKHGIRKQRNVLEWTPERIAWFREYVPGHTESEISDEHERLFGVPLTEGQIGNSKTRFKVKSGTHGGRFEKGHQWSGFHSEEHRRMFIDRGRDTRFKRGNLSGYAKQRHQEVGYERTNSDGYVEVKVKDGLQLDGPNTNFRHKHHIVWEQANGRPIPDGHNIVFADHDRLNFDPDNLVAVSRADWAQLRRRGLPYHDRESLLAAVAMVQLNHMVVDIECSDHVCPECGVTFKAKYAKQRRCRDCIDRSKR